MIEMETPGVRPAEVALLVTTEWIGRLPLFSGLPDSSLAALAGIVRRRRVPGRHTLFYQGDPVTALYYIDQGRVRISVVEEEGEESTINVLGDGDFFPQRKRRLLPPSPSSSPAPQAEAP